jgi:hypothetical protein
MHNKIKDEEEKLKEKEIKIDDKPKPIKLLIHNSRSLNQVNIHATAVMLE